MGFNHSIIVVFEKKSSTAGINTQSILQRTAAATSNLIGSLESGTSESKRDVSKAKDVNKPDPCKREPSLARIAAQNMIVSKPGRSPKNVISPVASSPEYNMHRPPRVKPVDKTGSRIARPTNRKPVPKKARKNTGGFLPLKLRPRCF